MSIAGAVLASPALAGPEGGVVVEGEATITYGENSIVIQQNSDRVIIEWQSFDVGANESVNFIQPSELAAALNRVLSGEASVILGSLTANGQITLVNPAGTFGAFMNIDVAAITATTLDIINTNFMAGDLVFDQYDDRFADASVTNDGTITVGDRGLAPWWRRGWRTTASSRRVPCGGAGVGHGGDDRLLRRRSGQLSR
ncbi:MAG: filamentous hemagglutinin N-terminal domain-containing protein [Alphaproteobacteria bacterium]